MDGVDGLSGHFPPPHVNRRMPTAEVELPQPIMLYSEHPVPGEDLSVCTGARCYPAAKEADEKVHRCGLMNMLTAVDYRLSCP